MAKRAIETIEIPTGDEYPVRGDLYIPDTPKPRGIVVLCHGFKGYKTWGFFPYVAGRIRDAGLAALSIDFSFNGTFQELPLENKRAQNGAGIQTPKRQSKSVYSRPDLFRINTLTRERNDLAAVMRFINEKRLDPYLTTTPRAVGLFGHSRGGVVAFLQSAAMDDTPAINDSRVTGDSGDTLRADALCTWSIPHHANIFDARQIEKWRRLGDYRFTDADGTQLSVAVEYLHDMEANDNLYDLQKQAHRLRTPHLIVHGKTDLAVDVDSARVLYDAETNLDEKQLLVLRTGHLFGVTYPPRDPAERRGPTGRRNSGKRPNPARRQNHPRGRDNQSGPADVLVEATDATVEWFSRFLGKGA